MLFVLLLRFFLNLILMQAYRNYDLSPQLDCGAQVTARGLDYMTPLSVATMKGAADIMTLLFKKCMVSL